MTALRLQVVTPHGVLDDQSDVKQVVLPGAEGQFGVLKGHIPFFAALKAGVVTIYAADKPHADKPQHVAVSKGYAQVSDNCVVVLADSACRADDIDRQKVEQKLSDLQSQLAEWTGPRVASDGTPLPAYRSLKEAAQWEQAQLALIDKSHRS